MAQPVLTTPMRRALIMAHRHGGLTRREGGFWTWPLCPQAEGCAPADYVDTPAVYALQKLGLLAPCASAWGSSVLLTDAGAEAARAAEGMAA